jgi:hypothetical protein
VNRKPRLDVLDRFPDRRSVTRRPPSLDRVPAVQVPRLPRYYEGAPTPATPSRQTLVLARRYPRCGGCFAPAGLRHRSRGQECSGSATPRADRRTREDSRSLRFLGNPGVCPPCSRTPAGLWHQATTVPQRGPSARSDGGLTARSLISGLNSTAFTLAVYASSSGSLRPTQDSLLAAGQALPGGIGYPQGSVERFPSYSSPFPRLCRTQERQSSAAGPAVTTLCLGKPQCRPRLLQRLDTHHGPFVSGMLEVIRHPAHCPSTRRPR